MQIPDEFPIKSVLVVDDDPGIRLVVTRSLEREGFVCHPAENAAMALELLKANEIQLVISDISMPGGMDGIDLLKRINSQYPDTSVIIMTGYGSDYSYVDIMDAGAADYMTKPFNMNSALARINRIAREKTNLINLKKSNSELCKAIERSNVLAREAKEASQAKTFFLASMSHEIRTPLNGIVGYTDMLMDTPLNEEQQLFLKNARLSCDTLLSVVNDILDFSKVEAGKMTLENISFDPEVLCYDTIDVVRPKVDESKIELLCSVADTVPANVIGDPHRFRQVLLNLLGNAVKFTDKGMIKLSLSASDLGNKQVELHVAVEDTGIGISEDQIERIFQPFVQSEDEITNRYGGTGLGLPISKNIAQKMGGDIQACAKKDEGAAFYFNSVLKEDRRRTPAKIKSASLSGKKILLCTTSPDARKIFLHDLNIAQTQVTHVAFSDLKEHLSIQSPGSYDVVIIDFGKTAKAYHESFEERVSALNLKQFNYHFIACSVPVPGIANIFHQFGFKGFLPKPVMRKKLFEMIAYVLGETVNTPESPEPEDTLATSHLISENRKHSVSILLVEDNAVNQKMTRLMLSKAGYQIEVASNGKAAFEAYRADPDRFDLIFMDINMPLMDGFTATKKIREFELSNPKAGRVPVLALTANVLDDFRLKCKASGMDDFLTKPIRRDVVFKAIQRWVN